MNENQKPGYNVRAWYDSPGSRDGGQMFGKFNNRKYAEECLLVLAGRGDVVSAQIEEIS